VAQCYQDENWNIQVHDNLNQQQQQEQQLIQIATDTFAG
jgi:hypothetical protein